MGAGFDRIAPVLPVRDVRRALEHYRRLGFAAAPYNELDREGPIYGFVRRGAVELHLARVADLEVARNTSSSYLYVSDADALHAEWKAAGVKGLLTEPVDTPYRLREFAHCDPDGNLLRVGSPIPA